MTRVRPLTPFPVLQIDHGSERSLVISDLHLGWEISFAEKGIFIPSQTSRMLTRLMTIIEHQKPDRIVIIGDVKHSIPRISLEEWRTIPLFFERLETAVSEIWVARGNHDGDLEPLTPPSVRILPSSGFTLGEDPRIGLFHGHAWPSTDVLTSELLVMGHIHPVLWFQDNMGLWMVQQVWVRALCQGSHLTKAVRRLRQLSGDPEFSDSRVTIIPAFNDLLGGVSVNNFKGRLLGPLLGSRCIDLASAELYLLDGTYLGEVRQLGQDRGNQVRHPADGGFWRKHPEGRTSEGNE
jgi:putative SbcD/Mre11-related phosphoesterase